MNRPRFRVTLKNPNQLPLFVIFGAILLIGGISLACNAPVSEDQASEDTNTPFEVQATELALQANQAENPNEMGSEVENADALQTVQAATLIAENVQATVDAQLAAQPIDPPPPSLTPQPTISDPPSDAPAEAPAVEEPADMEALIMDSKILLFENVTKIPLPRYIKQALDNLGLSRNYTDTKDATGNFKAELLSGTDWDLVVVGVEARSAIQGEFFDYFNEQVNNGAGIVLEIWNLDEIAGAKATSFLSNCGVQVQSDWYDPPSTARSIWWLYGEHPVFHEPNEGMSLVNYNPYWAGDAGDLLKIGSGGEAAMLAGTYAQEKNSYGVLAICHDGRVILQTYSSHDYRQDDVVRLWENYIYNALRAHFEYELGQ